MRMAFGLVGILVAIGVIVWIISAVEAPSAKQAIDVQKKLEPEVQQMAGKDASGEDARNSIKLDAESSNGRMGGVLVTALTPGGAMEKYFTLKRGDVITEIAEQGGVMMPVKEMASPSEAKDALLTSMQNFQQITVTRNELKLTLPVNTNAPAPLPSGKSSSGDTVQKQLDSIKIPTH